MKNSVLRSEMHNSKFVEFIAVEPKRNVIDELERIVQKKKKRDFMKITYTSILSAICV